MTMTSASKRLAIGWLLLQYAATTASAFAAILSKANGIGLHRAGFDGHQISFRCNSSSLTSTQPTTLFAIRGGGGDDDNQSNGDNNLRTVLVTGGAGYIGSHTCLELLKTGRYRVVVIDNLINSSQESLNRVRELLSSEGCENNGDERLFFRNCDIRDESGLQSVLEEFPSISSCIHFAGLKAVGESVAKPLSYYAANIGGTTTLLQVLQEASVPHFVFSSSATVYGEPEMLPLTESARLTATNPYGRTKLFIEEILRDLYASSPTSWNILILRYFNPIGAHPSGRMGEDPQVCDN
jgi:UDP-glucose 4-epimerase